MAKFDKRSAGSGPVVGPQSDLTRENWADRAKAFIATKGQDALGFVCSNGERTQYPATDAQWLAWLAWFESKGIPTAAKRAHGLFTVPTEWPEDFDAQCALADRSARLPFRSVPIDPDRADTAAWVTGRVNAATAATAMPKEKRRKDWNITPAEAEELMREAASKPLPEMSDALKASLGLKKAKDAA